MLLAINLDSTSRGFVFSEVNPKPFQIGDLYQEDTLDIEFTLLRRVNELVAPYFERINLAGYSLVVSLGTAGVVNASQATWTPDATGTKLTGTLEMNTAALNALANGTPQIFEARVSKAGVTSYKGQQTVRFIKAVYTSGALASPVGDTALGRLEALRLFVKREGGNGEGRILRSADGLQAVFEYLHNDGSIHTDPLL